MSVSCLSASAQQSDHDTARPTLIAALALHSSFYAAKQVNLNRHISTLPMMPPDEPRHRTRLPHPHIRSSYLACNIDDRTTRADQLEIENIKNSKIPDNRIEFQLRCQ
jgi:hypothetical protein